MISIAVTEASQVAEARRQSVAMAQGVGFGPADAGRVAIVAAELASNLVKHGGGGEILVGSFADPTGTGVELVAIDKGPGIGDVEGSMRDGHSTAGTPGTGLGAIFRQSQAAEVYSRPGLGAAVLARLSPGRDAAGGIGRHAERESTGRVGRMPRWGAVCLPKPGEEAQGDGWAAARLADGGLALMVADGLGHGPEAARASAQAVRIFAERPAESPGAIVQAIHEGLRPTRGGAVAVARIDPARSAVLFAGAGNIAGVLVDGTALRRMVSHNGTAGHSVRKIKEFEYPFRGVGAGLVILHSDGIAGSWTLDRYPGLAYAHPTLIAAVLYRDFNRGRDDCAVLVGSTGGDAP